MWESRVLQRAFERLELHEGKLSRAVLRGGGGGDVTSLPDTWVGNHPGLPGPRPTRPVGFPHSSHIGCLRGAKRDHPEPSGVQSRTVLGRPIRTYRSVSLAELMASKAQLLEHLTRAFVLRELPSLDHVPHRLAGRSVGNHNIGRKAPP